MVPAGRLAGGGCVMGNKAARRRILLAARDGELTYTPSARIWQIAGRLIDYASINLDPAEPDRCHDEGLLGTAQDGWDHRRGFITDAGRAWLEAEGG